MKVELLFEIFYEEHIPNIVYFFPCAMVSI